MMFYSLGQQYSSHDGFFGELFFHSKARLALFAYLQQCLCLLGMDASVFFLLQGTVSRSILRKDKNLVSSRQQSSGW